MENVSSRSGGGEEWRQIAMVGGGGVFASFHACITSKKNEHGVHQFFTHVKLFKF
jgi:hypothetical protein